MFFLLKRRRPPKSTRPDTPFPYPTLFRSQGVNRFLRAAANIAFAPTLGDVATTISHPPSSSHRALSEAGRLELGIGEGFIRVSVGIEDIALLDRKSTRLNSSH